MNASGISDKCLTLSGTLVSLPKKIYGGPVIDQRLAIVRVDSRP